MGTYRTTEGLDIIIRPVSMLLIGRIRQTVEAEMRIQGKPLDPPTYSVTTATGETETFPHDDESATSPEDKAALAAHLAAKAQLEAEQNRRTMKALFRRGIKVDAVPAGWAADVALEGVKVSEDPNEMRLEYIQMEILKTAADISGAIMAITQLSMSGANPEDLAAVQDTFRRPVAGTAAGPDRPTAA